MTPYFMKILITEKSWLHQPRCSVVQSTALNYQISTRCADVRRQRTCATLKTQITTASTQRCDISDQSFVDQPFANEEPDAGFTRG
jgi:hypothetical protein